ncbi:hypothetical protein [Rhodopila sp.]|uniref:hypothetical protein n=1 Tax=Rhodopila sp. TaxID=2480087 RepID=UPI003D0CF7CF
MTGNQPSDDGVFAQTSIQTLEDLVELGLKEGWPGREIACALLEAAYVALQKHNPGSWEERVRDFKFLAAVTAIFEEDGDPENYKQLVGPMPTLAYLEAVHQTVLPNRRGFTGTGASAATISLLGPRIQPPAPEAVGQPVGP